MVCACCHPMQMQSGRQSTPFGMCRQISRGHTGVKSCRRYFDFPPHFLCGASHNVLRMTRKTLRFGSSSPSCLASIIINVVFVWPGPYSSVLLYSFFLGPHRRWKRLDGVGRRPRPSRRCSSAAALSRATMEPKASRQAESRMHAGQEEGLLRC